MDNTGGPTTDLELALMPFHILGLTQLHKTVLLSEGG